MPAPSPSSPAAMRIRSVARGRRTPCASRRGGDSRSRPRPATRTGRTARPRGRGSGRLRRWPPGASSAPPRNRHAAAECVEGRRDRQRVGGEVEQPRRHDAAAPPDLGHRRQVDLVLVELGVAQRRGLGVDLAPGLPDVGVGEDVQPLRVGGHDPVLDPVVDHLHEVAGAGRAAVEIALLGGGRVAGPAGGARGRGHARGDGPEERARGGRPTSSSPPIIRQKPRSRPKTPPLVPMST